MRHSGNEKTQIRSIVRRENEAITRIFSLPAAAHAHAQSSGATLLVAFLAALIGLAVLLTVFARLWLSHYETQHQSTAAPRVAVLNQEAEVLQKRVVDLVSGSIEAKLQGIEKSIQQGQVTASDLQALDELRQELRILANYSTNSQALAADPMLIRGGIPGYAAADNRVTNVDVDELSFVKGLYYFGIVSMGIVSLLAGGYWLHHLSRQRRLPPTMTGRNPMLSRRRWLTPEE